jgi:L-alanine-DL-glutamate epimerase-like enolase superfamily enzyme
VCAILSSSLSVVPIESVRVGAFQIPTDALESDGTLEWDTTGMVVVQLSAAGETGLGYTYGSPAIGEIIEGLEECVTGADAFDAPLLNARLFSKLRNLGRQGASAMAVSAIDVAVWDLKARLLGVSLVKLLGQSRPELPLYGSGGFTSYTDLQLEAQFSGWKEEGFTRYKMKVGRTPERDLHRVKTARRMIGDGAELFVDANSAYDRVSARRYAELFASECGVSWLEEPLPPEDLEGLRFLRNHAPTGLDIAEGEYGYDLDYFKRLLEGDAADVVQADLTRCGGVTGFLSVAVLCQTWRRPLSTHCAPALHLHPACAAQAVRHAEYFHDHARIEGMLLDGVCRPEEGALSPDLAATGHGLTFKWSDAQRFAV